MPGFFVAAAALVQPVMTMVNENLGLSG